MYDFSTKFDYSLYFWKQKFQKHKFLILQTYPNAPHAPLH